MIADESSLVDGITTITFERAIDTGDANDLVVRDADVLVQWCTHADKPTVADCGG